MILSKQHITANYYHMECLDRFVDSMVTLIMAQQEHHKNMDYWEYELVPNIANPPMIINISHSKGYLTVHMTLYRSDFQGCICNPTFGLLRTYSPSDPVAVRRGLMRYCASHERDLKQFVDIVQKHGIANNNVFQFWMVDINWVLFVRIINKDEKHTTTCTIYSR